MAEAADFPGTSPSPARRWLRRTAALLVGTPLLAGLLQAPVGPVAHASGPGAKAAAAASRVKADATGSRTVDVSLDALTPTTPGEDDTLTVSGTVTNNGKQTVTAAQVGLRIGSPLGSRSEIDSAAKRTGFQPGSDGSEVGGKYVEKISKLAPGVRQDFSISVPVKALSLSTSGVYQLGVTLTGQSAAQPYPQVLGIERTFLPWQPDAADTKTKTTYLWPLTTATHLTARTGSDEQQTPVFKNDDLADELAPGGRLEQLLSLGSRLNVTWVIDPDLLASVEALTKNYRVENPDGETTRAGKQQSVAGQWLNDLQSAVKDKKVVALPFADPDLASLAHTGKAVSGSLGHLKEATEAGYKAVTTILQVTPTTDFAWPAEGAIDPSVVDVATSAGAHTVIARSDSLRETNGLQYSPSAARPIGGGTTAVVADARLSTAFQGDMTGAESSTLAVQEFLAQSLMINLQDPDRQRSIVVAPQRMPTASQAQTMGKALSALEDGKWSQPQELTAAAKAKPDPQATTRVPSAAAYPAALRKQELPRQAFEKIQNTKNSLERFQVILTAKDRVVTPFGRAIDREMATSWRGHPREGNAYRQSVWAYLQELTKQVSLVQRSDAKLSGRSATIPVSVQNNLVQGVDHLVLRLSSNNPTRLKIGDGQFEEKQIKIAGGHSQSVKFTTTANANGPVPVYAQLYTEDGEPYGEAVRFDVNVTEVTLTVMLVIAGGLLLLVLAGFRMYTQRKRAARKRAQEGPDEGPEQGSQDGPDHGPEGESGRDAGTDDPEHPSDPTPDTAPESTDPSDTGERVDR
ncbi:hypothetical protein DEJ49_18185 [Streptomyces venezuelae]|uniref:Uncharacterized protein n=1 Tax=Streptomyces venezuelae TaxID=54571 RepID=A0A5P2CIR1_STRVZ|nr:DUF6049 family protein [Streptomyces venezuelae]QES42655.1 hypothetical protein DEJ49_18185 [Streptomyces venezuelae]